MRHKPSDWRRQAARRAPSVEESDPQGGQVRLDMGINRVGKRSEPPAHGNSVRGSVCVYVRGRDSLG